MLYTISEQHWPVLQRYAGTIGYSLIEAQKREMEEADTVSALASLSMVAAKRRYFSLHNSWVSVTSRNTTNPVYKDHQ